MTNEDREPEYKDDRQVWIPEEYIRMIVGGALSVAFIVGWILSAKWGQDLGGDLWAGIIAVLYPFVFAIAFPFFNDTAKLRQAREDDFKEKKLSRRERRILQDDSNMRDYHDPG